MTPDIGELLAEARRGRGLSIKDVESALKIRARHIQALERGEASTIHGEAYAIAFLRSYASYLELDANELVQRYREQSQPVSTDSLAKSRLQQNLRILWLIGVVVVVALVARAVITGIAAKPLSPKPADAPAKKRPVQTRPKPAAPVELVLSLEAQVPGGAWVRVSVDGKVAFEGILPANQARQWRARDAILIRTGKPSQVIVRRNGKLLGPVGSVERLYKLKE